MNLLIEETPTHTSIKINRLEEGHNSTHWYADDLLKQ